MRKLGMLNNFLNFIESNQIVNRVQPKIMAALTKSTWGVAREYT